jgi:large subunit ribosomal protein L24
MAKPMPRRHQSAPKTLIRTRIKKDDTVMVITGRDKGKTGRVLEVDREKGRVLVEGVMMVKRHTRPNPQRQIKGGIAERESSIHVSNVMIVTSEGKPTRVAVKMEGARKTRVATARRGGETLDKK